MGWKQVTLNGLKRRKSDLSRYVGREVLIFSQQWGLYWRPDGRGYTDHAHEAGVYDFQDAWERVAQCGPEKRIIFRFADFP